MIEKTRPVMPWGVMHEFITVNGTQHLALVDRTKRLIVLRDDVFIKPSDTIVVLGITGAVDSVEHWGDCTVVRLGSA